jgi:hypothetical protein
MDGSRFASLLLAPATFSRIGVVTICCQNNPCKRPFLGLKREKRRSRHENQNLQQTP